MRPDLQPPPATPTACLIRPLVAVIALLVAAACSDTAPTAPARAAGEARLSVASAGAETVTGIIAVRWGDPATGGPPRLGATLRRADGNLTPLELDAATLAAAGGTRALDGQLVEVRAERSAALRGATALRVKALRVTGRLANPRGARKHDPVSVAKPYVTVLCRFSDSPAVVPRPKSVYESWMGTTYPGLDHYWRQMSYDRINLGGSTVVGWYTLPRTRAEYLYPDGRANLDLLGLDCTRAADRDVDFTRFAGINTQYNDVLDCCSWGGAFPLYADGEMRTYPFTWMASWADQAVYAHETGHSLGFPHSSGPYGLTYDSQWDVMSNPYIWYVPALATSVGQGTIAYHRDLAGWIPDDQKLTLERGRSRNVHLEHVVEPDKEQHYLLVQIPIANAPGQFYTVEARALVGYDAHIPGGAIVIHRVDPAGASDAIVVDADNNGNPNDAGAMWTEGETFSDPANGITVAVKAESKTGYRVVVSNQ